MSDVVSPMCDVATACVVGGAGFVGSHVADALSDAGFRVRVFDRVKSRWLRSNQEMCVGEIRDSAALDAAVKGCNVVFHFAGLSDLNQARLMPVEAAELNVLGTVRLLDACRRAGVRRFLYASTIYVYSRDGGFYRSSKQSAELFVEEFGRSSDLEFVILRFGSIYGPRSDDSNGLYRLVRSALRSRQMSYAGSPESIREYVHVEDVARACVDALGPEFRNRCVVITGRESTRVKDLALMLSEILGLPPDSLQFGDEHALGHYVRTPYSDMPRIAQKYTPPMHVDLGQGLLQLVDYVRAREGDNGG